MNQQTHRVEIESGQRFEFGANWTRFLETLTDDRIAMAEKSLCEMLGVTDLSGKTFLDAGSGSGLFSLVARKLGARVHSFDFDPKSVACTSELKRKHFVNDAHWSIEEASVLDPSYLAKLGNFDVVYSWGVLHHTGAMWTALDNIVPLVAPGGYLFIAIYNEQGLTSRYWRRVKEVYVRWKLIRWPMLLVHAPYLLGVPWLKRALTRRPSVPRGMGPWHDLVDWVGGYPFEVAKPEAIFAFFRDRGFQLRELRTCGGRLGCNEFVFVRALPR